MTRRGNIVMAVLFMLLLSITGLALLTHTLLHNKIIGARANKWRVTNTLEQALLLQLHRYREKLQSVDINVFSAPESDFFNDRYFPNKVENACQCQNNFKRQILSANNDFSKIRILNRIEARQKSSRLLYSGQAAVDLLMGNIPLSEFALLVNREITETPAVYLSDKGVECSSAQFPVIGKLPVSAEIERLLTETLQLSDRFPNWRLLREKFALESTDAPIRPGIYFVKTGETIAAIFVQGDLQKLEFAAASGWQSITFWQDNRPAELAYQPGAASLKWSGAEAIAGLLFAEKIIVHGNVWAIEQSGTAAFLPATRVQILACGQMVIRSALECENLTLQKNKIPSLLLMTSERDFFSGETVNADIVLDTAGEKTVQAQLLSGGKLINHSGSVTIAGGLYAEDIENDGRLEIKGVAGQFDFGNYLGLKNFKCLKNFCVQFITEGAHE